MTRSRKLVERPTRWQTIKTTLVLLLTASVLHGQDLRLQISVPKTTIRANEPLKLTAKLSNEGNSSVFAAGSMTFGVPSEFGIYRLEFQKFGASGFTQGQELAVDTLARVSGGEAFVSRNNLILLGPGEFIGKLFKWSWFDLTSIENTGRYNVRVTFDFFGSSFEISGERHSVPASRLLSNVIELTVVK
jgi:hypothetical protein